MKRSLPDADDKEGIKCVKVLPRDPEIDSLLETKNYSELLDLVTTYATNDLERIFSTRERCILFLHSGLLGKMGICESLAATVDLSSDDMTDAVVDVLVRDRIAQATKSGLVAGLVRNGAANDVVERTRTGLLELATRCLNDIVSALGARAQDTQGVQLPDGAQSEVKNLSASHQNETSKDEPPSAALKSG